MAIRMHEPIPTATADLTDDTPRPPSDDMLAKIQFCAEYTTADICDVMQAYMAGDTKPLEALLTRRQEISATVQAETQAKLDAASAQKIQGTTQNLANG
jgi:hypothetical protein